MPVVTFLPSFRKVTVPVGGTILDAARTAGIQMNVVCGGQGKCGKCVVVIKNGEVTIEEGDFSRFFSAEEQQKGYCLACKVIIRDDLQVLVPESSQVQEQQILIDALGSTVAHFPAVWKFALTLQPPNLENPSPDLSRLLWGIERQGGPMAKKIYAPLEVIRRIPRILRLSGWRVTATVALVPGGYRLIDLEKGDTTANLYGAAVDLGTTTVVAFIRSLSDGRMVGVGSTYNRQISCGEDILARVNYAKREGGLDTLQGLAVESINLAITEAANRGGVDREDIYEVVVAGNTVMTHILMGIDPGYMIEEPYVPVVRRHLTTSAGRIGVAIEESAGVFIFPAVSDYIGGDIVADILACGMADREEISLLIDIGTNFEVVLGNREWMFSCAGAAGPALEGGEVLFGMRANPGAIERITIDPATLEPTVATINNTPPRGICGSGLIDLLANLLETCIIDRTGRINTGVVHPRIRMGAHHPEYLLVPLKESGIGKDIVVTESDIKNLIMSKASVLAACITLMNEAGITTRDIAAVYFSGAFGNWIHKENAITIGLIPEVTPERIHTIGNGAIEGATIALLNRKVRRRLDEIAHSIAYIELNASSAFMEEYTRAMFLPHTDLSLFPGVEEKLNACRARRG
ncbi:MAG: ASKHA domain-containing protein [Methanomicrobiales archaeon]|jgi:uncharacterized 2Fe-2S/4Fe-4S cluster protein (DUF4445 family)|nr:ASKHA domain-containing protein [Methanomicrobiales archaeon]